MNIILRVQWLRTLRDVVVNWNLMTLKIKKHNQVLLIKGDPQLAKSKISIHFLLKIIEAEDERFLLQVARLNDMTRLNQHMVLGEIQTIIK